MLIASITEAFQAVGADIKAGAAALVQHKGSADHDSRYYTQTEVDTLLANVGSGGAGPNNLLVYYGWPIAYQGLWDAASVAQSIANHYDTYIVGDAYQDPSHESYANTVQVLAQLKIAGVKLYGYIPLGVNNDNLSLATIQTRILQWKTLGVDGIFLDEFGFDYQVTRQRQIDAVNAVHAQNLAYCANAWTWQDVGCDHDNDLPETWAQNDWRRVNFRAYNPDNLVLPRTSNDAYMFENFGFDHNGPKNQFEFLERAKVMRATNTDKLKIWALGVLPEDPQGTLNTTLSAPFTTVGEIAEYVWAAGYVFGFNHVGINGYSFGSAGGTASFVVPKVAFPSHLTYDNFTDPVVAGSYLWAERTFKGGAIRVDTDPGTNTYSYSVSASDGLGEDPVEVAMDAHIASGDHDTRYYQKSEADTALGAKLSSVSGVAQGLKYKVVALGNSTGTRSIDLSAAQEFTTTITGNVTFSFTNAPGANESQVVFIRMTNAGSRTINWPANTKLPKGVAPTFTAAGVDLIGVKYDSTTGTYILVSTAMDVK